MSVSLNSNFLRNARGLTLTDGGGVVWSINKNTNAITATVSGATGGTVTSVGFADDSTAPIYTVGSTPVTGAGTITITFKTQSANTVLAGPASGAAAQPTFRALVAADIQSLAPTWSGAVAYTLVQLVYGTTVSLDASKGRYFGIVPTDGVGFTMAKPTNGITGQEIVVLVVNTTGGALGTITWASGWKLAAWTNPANGNNRSITFRFDGTNYYETSRTPADVPN